MPRSSLVTLSTFVPPVHRCLQLRKYMMPGGRKISALCARACLQVPNRKVLSGRRGRLQAPSKKLEISSPPLSPALYTRGPHLVTGTVADRRLSKRFQVVRSRPLVGSFRSCPGPQKLPRSSPSAQRPLLAVVGPREGTERQLWTAASSRRAARLVHAAGGNTRPDSTYNLVVGHESCHRAWFCASVCSPGFSSRSWAL